MDKINSSDPQHLKHGAGYLHTCIQASKLRSRSPSAKMRARELLLQEVTQGDACLLRDKELCQEKPTPLLCRMVPRDQEEGCSAGMAPQGPQCSSEVRPQQSDISWATPWFS